jgi:hypothetical protein
MHKDVTLLVGPINAMHAAIFPHIAAGPPFPSRTGRAVTDLRDSPYRLLDDGHRHMNAD